MCSDNNCRSRKRLSRTHWDYFPNPNNLPNELVVIMFSDRLFCKPFLMYIYLFCHIYYLYKYLTNSLYGYLTMIFERFKCLAVKKW